MRMHYKTDYRSPIGNLMIVSDSNDIIGLWMEGQKYFASTVKEELVNGDDQLLLLSAKDWLNRYFAGEKPDIKELPLNPNGSGFRQEVWKILCEIPYGETMTYGEIAKKVAVKLGKKSMSAQAIGGAVGHNPISIMIPCHRVVGSDGSMTGYAGGIEKKMWLLEHEKNKEQKFRAI